VNLLFTTSKRAGPSRTGSRIQPTDFNYKSVRQELRTLTMRKRADRNGAALPLSVLIASGKRIEAGRRRQKAPVITFSCVQALPPWKSRMS
jgi:hypothetical protein